jgi:2-polyprenyl-3-methyl-5-hydroxy-6-metoxy-1,4-benzoquinol methylase
LPFLQALVHRHFPGDKAAAILDLGCGHGALIYVARQMGYRNVEGVDGSPEQVAAAERLGIEGVCLGDARKTLAEQADGSLDAVVCFDLIEHFTKDELIELLDEVYRVLKPGGRWIIHTPNAESPFGNRMFFWDFTHELAFTRTSLAQLLLSSGFREVNCYEDRPVPHGLKSAVRRLLWYGIRGLLRFYLAVETGDMGRNAIFSQNLLAVAVK